MQASRGASGILDRIVDTKRREIQALLSAESSLREALMDAPPARDLAQAFRRPGEVAIMAEVKRRSPGAGPIRTDLVPAEVAAGYEAAGAAAVSVLTDVEYFGGSMDDLREVRANVRVPVFRKDFVVHEIQLLQARAMGADGVLLIARILSDDQIRALQVRARELGLTPLVEVHGRDEVARALDAGSKILGVNNRDLATFQTSLDVTLDLLSFIPPDVTVVSESGIRTREDVDRLGAAGIHAVLVGESLLRASDPGAAAEALVGCPRAAREVS
jgi:indole-3-glycerol phosphate synthase